MSHRQFGQLTDYGAELPCGAPAVQERRIFALEGRAADRFHRKNAEGWFRVDLRADWVTPAEMLFVKPKTG